MWQEMAAPSPATQRRQWWADTLPRRTAHGACAVLRGVAGTIAEGVMSTNAPTPRHRRLPFLLYGIVALALSLLLLSSFTFLKHTGATTSLPPIPTVTPLNSTPLPTIAAVPTVTPPPTPTPGPPTPTPECCSGPSGMYVFLTPLQGPVGTNVTVAGEHQGAGHLFLLGFSVSGCVTDVRLFPGAQATADEFGYFSLAFSWPLTSAGAYIICVIDKTADVIFPADGQFQVTSGLPATITVTPSVNSGQSVQVRGTHFLPSSVVEILYGASHSKGCANAVGLVTTASDGTFEYKFDAPFVQETQIYIVTAVAPARTCGARPAQVASAYLRDVGASPTAQPPAATDSGNPFNLPTPV